MRRSTLLVKCLAAICSFGLIGAYVYDQAGGDVLPWSKAPQPSESPPVMSGSKSKSLLIEMQAAPPSKASPRTLPEPAGSAVANRRLRYGSPSTAANSPNAVRQYFVPRQRLVSPHLRTSNRSSKPNSVPPNAWPAATDQQLLQAPTLPPRPETRKLIYSSKSAPIFQEAPSTSKYQSKGKLNQR